ncbi:MAG: hypothetical protein GC146_09090 [Limimaricola sp.]|uniref:hypothetical protein n=1 Tax=Limimaricola sp. TaxID=2211665 RepID=UPI001E0A415A|nr:hypothetical protein [Limimaricola sp.]MBI1417364.1 hypothetical protein [Limimaricola sp.]
MTQDPGPTRSPEFILPGKVANGIVGVAIIIAAIVGVLLALVAGSWSDPATIAWLLLGLVGAVALGLGMINAWRTPALTIRPGQICVPSFFGERRITVRPGELVAELLATPVNGGNRVGPIEANRFVHLFVRDADGRPVQILAMHPAAPEVDKVRRALGDIAGLRVVPAGRAPGAKRPVPDPSSWDVP